MTTVRCPACDNHGFVAMGELCEHPFHDPPDLHPLTAERRAEIERECRIKEEITVREGETLESHGVFVADHARIARYVDAQVVKALEEACKAVCRECRLGLAPFDDLRLAHVTTHDEGSSEGKDYKSKTWTRCKAAPIRALLAARRKEQDNGPK